MTENVEAKPKVSITAEKPVPVVPKFVKVSVSGFAPFFMSFDGDTSVIEKAFSDAFGVELERKSSAPREPAADKPKRRGRKPKADAVAA